MRKIILASLFIIQGICSFSQTKKSEIEIKKIGSADYPSSAANLDVSEKNTSVQSTCSIQNFVLVELFCSEGCSSCPNADAYFNAMDSTNANLNALFLAHHVDYWNVPLYGPCGVSTWVDPLSSSVYTDLQKDYTYVAGASSTGTPEMIIQGEKSTLRDIAPTQANSTAASYFKQTATRGVCIQPISIDTVAHSVTISYSLLNSAHNATENLYVAMYEDGLSAHVTAGENCGSTLRYKHITRQLTGKGIFTAADTTGTVTFSYPAEVKAHNAGVLAYIQDATNMHAVAGTKGFTIPQAFSGLTSVQESKENVSVKVYPNPASTSVSFAFEGGINFNDYVSLDLYNITGSRVKTIAVSSRFFTLDLEKEMPAGIYMYVVYSDKGQYLTGKLVKQ